MTLLVASLFLPFTVEFQLKEDSVNPEIINSLPLQTTLKKTNQPASTSISSARPPLTSQNSTSILQKTINTEEFKTRNSSIEDFFFQSNQSPNESSSLEKSQAVAFNEELRSKLNNLQARPTAKFIPKSRVATPPVKSVQDDNQTFKKYSKLGASKNYQKSKLNVSSKDDPEDSEYVSVSEEEYEFSDDDGYDTLYNKQKIPKFSGLSRKDLLVSKNAEEIFENSTFDIVEFCKGNGALKNAILSSLKPNEYKWIGTVGVPTDELPDDVKSSVVDKLATEFNCESVLPSDFTFQGHYKSYCKQILWPTLHYQIPDDPNSKAFEDHSWDFYKQLNQQFADKIVEIYKDGDLVWVHDYHLFLVPEMVRKSLPNAKIGFYLHVSFPSSEVFKCFAHREEMLKGILGANFVSFQTDEYARHFSQTCNKLLLADISKGEIRYQGATIKIASSPVGIDADQLSSQITESQEVRQWRSLIRDRWPTQKLIVGRDKFDKIRGVKQKLLAYELFLNQNPEYVESTVLIQICLKSKNEDDNKLEAEIMSIVDRINSLCPNISASSQPVVFLHQDIEFVQYLALIAEADCFIVSSMREGMNLTCHEFIVATAERKAPLILSEFTGSAAVLKKGALKINPWGLRQVSLVIKQSLELDDATKLTNWNELIKVVKNQDCHHWVSTNLENIQKSWKLQSEKNKTHVLNVKTYEKRFHSAKNRLFIFHISTIPNERILKILSELSLKNDVFIYSNYKRLEMERLYRRLLPRVGLIAENGGLIKFCGNSSWFSLVNRSNFKQWLAILRDVLKSYEERIPNSFIEPGETFIKFHTEDNFEDPERRALLVGDLITYINSMNYKSDLDDDNELKSINMHATVSEDIVYVQNAEIALRSVKLLVDLYTKGITDLSSYGVEKIPSDQYSIDDLTLSRIDFLTIGGKSDIIFEPVFEYGIGLNKDSPIIPVIYTIGYSDEEGFTTSSTEQVEGLNELFTVLAKC